jgi:peptide/nickel transport system permease protein
MAVSVAIPVEWPPLGCFFRIMMIFALWLAGLAREVRGKVLSYREEEFVMAAHAAGAGGLISSSVTSCRTSWATSS